MALPADLLAAHVTGRVVDGTTGAVIPIIVEFVPNFTVLNDLPGGTDPSDTGSIVVGFPTLISVDNSTDHTNTGGIWDYAADAADGTFNVTLLGYSDGVNGKGYTYTVTVKRKSDGTQLLSPWNFKIQAGATVDLSAMAPVAASGGSSVSVVNVGGSGGGGTGAWADITGKPAFIAAGSTAAAARTAIGATDLVLGTSATTAKAGNAHDAWSDITSKPAVIAAGADQAAARAAIAAGTSSLVTGTTAGTAAAGNDSRLSDARVPLSHTHVPTDITGSGTVGRAVLATSTEGAARTAVGMSALGSSLVTAADQAAMKSIIGVTDGADGAPGVGVLVLGPSDAVPGGTAANTVIVRKVS
ncbi:hypothetical protein [Nakamurella lactea]|uniref:hypothetical protein n=1 Tax=Nakamurella lactea TaxID=459515 RepID=UPI00041E649C|nr:hypothetical protein [Nakamurella lactea]